MNELLNKIFERPRKEQIGILAAVIILLLVAGYFYLYEPRSNEIAKLSEEVGKSSAERDKMQKQAANIPKLKKDLEEMEGKLKQAVAQLPNKREIGELLRSISNKAQETGLEVTLFRPRGENFQEFYAEVPVEMVVKGSFAEVVSFFDEVGRLTRLVNLDNIGFKNPRPTGDRVVLETSTVATAFRFLDEAERKKIAEEKAKAAKSK